MGKENYVACHFSACNERRREFMSVYHRKHPKFPRYLDFQVAVAVSILPVVNLWPEYFSLVSK